MALTAEQVKARLLSARFRRRQFSGLLLDPRAFLAGLGNYLRVEILWQCGLAPQHNAAQLTDEQLDLRRIHCWIFRACHTRRARRGG